MAGGRLAILGGGIVFVLTLLGVASAHSFGVLLVAFIAFYPASGAFVSLTQAEIMDAWPDRQARLMARWDLAGARPGRWPGRCCSPWCWRPAEAGGPGSGAGRHRRAQLARACLRPAPGPPAAGGTAHDEEAGLSAATAMWYPIVQARLYGSLPGRSSVAVTLSSAAGLAGGLGPLAVGLAAQGLGLSWALAGLAFVPVAVLVLAGRERAPARSA